MGNLFTLLQLRHNGRRAQAMDIEVCVFTARDMIPIIIIEFMRNRDMMR